MCSILLDGLILVAILCVVTGEDFGSGLGVFFKAGLLALATSIVGLLLAVGLSLVMPPLPAGVLGIALASLGLGFAVSHIYDVELKRSMLGVGVFFVISIAMRVVLSFASGPP